MKKSATKYGLCCVAIFMATQLFAFRADDTITSAAMGTAPATFKRAAPQIMPTAEQKEAVNELDNAQVEWDAKTGAPASIRSQALSAKNLGGKNPAFSLKNDFAFDAVAVMDRLTRAYKIRDAAAEFQAFKTEVDELGFHHVRLNQMYQGRRVVGGQLNVHFDKSGKAYQVNGRYVPDITVATEAVIDQESAIESARQDLLQATGKAGHLKGAVELVIYARDVSPRLAYELTLVYENEKAGPGNWHYWIDARDGSVINRYNDIRKIDAAISGNLNSGEGGDAVSVTGENSGYYYLRYTTRHWEIYDYPNSRIARNSTATWPADTAGRSEMSAAYNFNLIQAYYYGIHHLNSFDNSGKLAVANLHYHASSDDYDNAFWDPDSQQFYFYPGNIYAELTVLDVCGHEFTHAVTEHSANLVYQNESGALNESFSDIFGTVIEFVNQPDGRGSYPARTAGCADWLLGEDSTYPSYVAIRDMRNPQSCNNPSRYHGTDWYYGSGDHGGVHYNSGVQNHFFYLLCEGGSGTNDGISYNLTGLGVTNANLIAYRALTVYCNENTDYAAVRTAWISAAIDLNLSWVSAVQAAWAAVGVTDTLQFSSSSASVTENTGSVTLTITRFSGSFGTASVNYATANGTALAGTDYTATSGTVQWTASDSANKTIAIPILKNPNTQVSRAFTVTLSGASGARLGSTYQATVTITDRYHNDYDGDGRTDLAVYRDGYWRIYLMAGSVISGGWGGPNSTPVSGDYDGDGRSDLAVYHNGNWSIYTMAGRVITGGWGTAGWTTVPGDYDGDGKADLAVYHNGFWSIYSLANGIIFNNKGGWGGPDSIPVSGDYDGDGKSDLAVYRNGNWSIYLMAGSVITGGWGAAGWTPVPGDYDGDGKSDLAVYHNGFWSIYSLANGIIFNNKGGWGGPDSIPVSGDYDGDGKSDLAVYRNGNWSIYLMAGSVISGGWGGPGWTPVP